ncbi:hypothetical protein ABL78_5684 [Leptomonas seymouri]|uniref:Uncharacterized protein n=1 Tax=Leptomonas seymouri TaxID=5684 RepID=A0A0N0P4V6_LEPSE|nr:hypothetical protein ABL78_5684 [Leptomonas seymouri]|eukprot:KPI85267.1 hypothetical protein ABL78_5684 [Leptomonas seymouri]
MGHTARSAYEFTLRHLLETCSHFSSWEAMIAEDENPDLSPSRTCSFLPAAPPLEGLLEVWLVEVTMGHPKEAGNDCENTSGEATCRRWTRILGLWISLRLAGLIASAGAGNEAFWSATHFEIESYEQFFLFVAWPLLDANQRMRLRSRIAHLRNLCEAALPQPHTPPKADNDAAAAAVVEDSGYKAACSVLCNSAMRATQCVAREYLRITWDALNPKQMPEVVDRRLQVLFSIRHPLQLYHDERETVPSALAASGVVHTSSMVGLLRTLQRTYQRHHTADHTYRVWMRMVRTALLLIGYNLVVKARTAMIDFCYFLLPALMDFEACVMLCEAMENEMTNTVTPVDDAAASGDAEESEQREQLRRTLAALLQSTEVFYEETIDGILFGYRKSCVSAATPPRLLTAIAVEAPANPLAPLPPPLLQRDVAAPNQSFRGTLPIPTPDGSSGEVRQYLSLSQAAYALLVEVVEPTCNVLRRYPAETNFQRKNSAAGAAARRKSSGRLASPERHKAQHGGGSGCGSAARTTRNDVTPSASPSDPSTVKQRFMKFFKAKVTSCFTDAIQPVRERSASTKAEEQAAMDAHVVAAYLSAAQRH